MHQGLDIFWVLALAAILLFVWVRALALAIIIEEKPGDKIIWSLVVFFGGLLGALLYLLIRWPFLRREEQQRDSEMLQQMREDFVKGPSAVAKP